MADQEDKKTITVAGVTFSADQVKTATLNIDDREVVIYAPKEPKKQIGFSTEK